MSAVSTIATGDGPDAPERREADQRGRRRYGTSMPATILISHYDRVPCVVRDLSDGGAKIGLSRRYALSNRFWIVIRHAEIARRASLVWRRGDFAGIAFDRPLERGGGAG
ncbi:PilZ domain-containing protein [Methylobacterium terrae]|nr:PilZ domain-containing protein [Methylobacterium terrae]